MLEQLAAAIHLDQIDGWAILDILVLAAIIYQLLLLIRGTRAAHMLVGVVGLVVIHFLTRPGLFHLAAVHSVLGDLLLYIPFAVIVVFQNQIRQALARLGRRPLSALIPKRRHEHLAKEVALAGATLASKKTGALIVIERDLGLRLFYETGIALDALVSYDLLLNIFAPGSPLHDGAAIIADGRIRAAACYLPLTIDPNLSRAYGTRHRAAIGLTEESDALAVVVSEERGTVSLALGGKIISDLDAQSLEGRLRIALGPRSDSRGKPRGRAGVTVPDA